MKSSWPGNISLLATGGFDFLGLRKGAAGNVEIVYDDGVARRMVWRVEGRGDDPRISDAFRQVTRVNGQLVQGL